MDEGPDPESEIELLSHEIAAAADAARSNEAFQEIAEAEAARDDQERRALRAERVVQLRESTRRILAELQSRHPEDIDYRATSGIGASGALVIWKHAPHRRLEIVFNTMSNEIILDQSVPGGLSSRDSLDVLQEDIKDRILNAILWVAGRAPIP